MALTDRSDLYAAIHEGGINRVVRHVFRQRPSLINYASTGLLQQITGLCALVDAHPVAVARGNLLISPLPPLQVVTTGYAVEYSLQVTAAEIDMSPGDVVSLPAELNPPLEKQRLAVHASACFGFGCPPLDVVRLLPYRPPTGRDEPRLTPIPIRDLLCTCLDFFAVLGLDFNDATGRQDLLASLDGLEIADLAPAALENTIECYVGLVLRLGLLPLLDRLDLFPISRPVGELLTLTVQPTPASAELPNNPAVEDDQIKTYFDIAAGPPGPPQPPGRPPGPPRPEPTPGIVRPRIRTGPFDATVAAAEKAVQELFGALRDSFSVTKSDSRDFGPFSLSYDVELRLENGTINLRNDGSIRVSELDVAFGLLRVCFGIDIPRICVGGFCIIPNPFGGCILQAPRLCLFEEDPDLELCLDLAPFVRSEISATVSPVVKYSVNPGRTAAMNDWDAVDAGLPNHWQVFLDPGAIDFDLFDVADIVGNLLDDALNAAIDGLLGPLPGWVKALVRSILGPIIDLVRAILDLGDDLTEWLSDKLGVGLGLFDFILSAVADLLAKKEPLLNQPEPLVVLPGEPGLMPVLVPIEFLGVQVTGDELVIGVDVGSA